MVNFNDATKQFWQNLVGRNTGAVEVKTDDQLRTYLEIDTISGDILWPGSSLYATDRLNALHPSYGVKGDGVTLDTVAINKIITDNPGKTIFFPAGTYLIDATTGIKLNQVGTRLQLDQGAVIQVKPNNQPAYMAIEVTAADCVIEGGTIKGDVGTHDTASGGEWGHLVVAQAGAHRLRVANTILTKAWGDGIAIQGGPQDVNIVNVTCDDNRRQGISVIASARTRIFGGVFKNTGQTLNTAPSAGIDIEPNAGGSVTDCHIVGALCFNNRGPGLQIASAAGSVCEVTVSGVRSIGSTNFGFYVVGPSGTIKAVLSDCYAGANALHGFSLNSEAVELKACTARSNTQYGIQVNSSFCTLIGCNSLYNGRVGIQISGIAVDSTAVIGCDILANSQEANGTYFNFDNWGVNTRLVSVLSDAGTQANKPAAGFSFRASSSCSAVGCSSRNAYTSSVVSDLSAGGTVMNPNPQATAPFSALGAGTTTVAPAAGGAGALPATPLGYVTVNINGTDRKVPYYA